MEADILVQLIGPDVVDVEPGGAAEVHEKGPAREAILKAVLAIPIRIVKGTEPEAGHRSALGPPVIIGVLVRHADVDARHEPQVGVKSGISVDVVAKVVEVQPIAT